MLALVGLFVAVCALAAHASARTVLLGRSWQGRPIEAVEVGVKDAPTIQQEGDELSQAHESALYHHYQLNYTPSDTPSGRRLAHR